MWHVVATHLVLDQRADGLGRDVRRTRRLVERDLGEQRPLLEVTLSRSEWFNQERPF